MILGPFSLYSNVFRINGGEDNMSAHKKDSHAKIGHCRIKLPKEEATFDTELQRYIMPSETSIG